MSRKDYFFREMSKVVSSDLRCSFSYKGLKVVFGDGMMMKAVN
jgi:hypothetical protein